MRVAVVFSDYRSDLPSGEREVVRNECAALTRAGVEVHLVSASTDQGLRDPLYALRAAGRVATGFGGSPLERIRDLQPDIVHVHNLFPNFGSRWLAELDLPLVVTLHNYRSVCAEGSLFREGSPCTLCPDGAKWSGLRHRCYRDSAAATLPLALANRRGLLKNPLIERADRIFVPSEFHRELLIRFGLDPERSRTSPSFVQDCDDNKGLANTPLRTGWVYVGRLDAGKGILPLVESWPSGEPLTVIGDGPLRAAVALAAGPEIQILGLQSRNEVRRLLREAEGLIFPSRNFETQGLVYLEALQAGTPVIAREGNAVAATIRSEITGVTYNDEGQLEAAIDALRTDAQTLSEACLHVFNQRYCENVWRTRRLEEYQELSK